MLPFSGSGERIRPGGNRRSQEISMVMSKALEPVVDLSAFPNSVVDVFVELPQTDAGTRCAAISAAAIALADAGIPMKGMVTSVAVAKVDGTLVLDPMKEEDNYGEADIPFAFLIRNGKIESITLLQMDGRVSKEELKMALEIAKKGAMQIYQLQREAILKKYIREEEVVE
jgi:exosome complex component RRP41